MPVQARMSYSAYSLVVYPSPSLKRLYMDANLMNFIPAYAVDIFLAALYDISNCPEFLTTHRTHRFSSFYAHPSPLLRSLRPSTGPLVLRASRRCSKRGFGSGGRQTILAYNRKGRRLLLHATRPHDDNDVEDSRGFRYSPSGRPGSLNSRVLRPIY